MEKVKKLKSLVWDSFYLIQRIAWLDEDHKDLKEIIKKSKKIVKDYADIEEQIEKEVAEIELKIKEKEKEAIEDEVRKDADTAV